MELNFAPKGMQMSILQVPQKSASFISSLWFATRGGCSQPLAYCLVPRSTTLFSSRKFKGRSMKLVRRARFNDFSHGELSKWIEGEVQPLDDTDTNDKDDNEKVHENGGQKGTELNFSMQLLPSKIEFPEPGVLGIWPEPPDWPERDEVRRFSIEQKANSVGIPLSLRIIKRKQRWKEGFVDAGEFAYCSVKKAVSSLVLIIRELQNYTLVIREGLNCEDLLEIMAKMQRDMNLTFVWLFQQVFSKTPTLMVYVMLLLANFSVHSMADKAFVDATQQPRFTQKAFAATMSLTSEEYPHVVPDETAENSFPAKVDGEYGLWKSVVEEASRMRGELFYKVLDHQIRQQLVSPLNVHLEPDNHEGHFRTNLVYQMRVAEEPNNPLLLSNYAQFLHLVVKDHDRAEECFKRAIQAEPQDAEALGLYADFLWQVRNDLWEAEERYLQAVAADPENPFHASKYANFLWSTGGEGTCFPLSSSSYDSYNKVP